MPISINKDVRKMKLKELKSEHKELSDRIYKLEVGYGSKELRRLDELEEELDRRAP